MPFDPTAFDEDELPNGVRVFMNLNFPVDAVLLGVMLYTGSRGDGKGREGAVHCAEHGALMGSVSFPEPENLTAPIEHEGGEFDAWTDFDHVMFFANVPPEHIALGVRMLDEVLRHAAFDAEKFEKEREVIVREWRDQMGNPDMAAMEACFAALFGEHPLGHMVIGTEAS